MDLFSDAPIMPWTVTASDLSSLAFGGPHLEFSWDATTGQPHEWIGYVAQN